ncbi:MAG: hypothetical protein M1821_003673 [Bathelium mastoideum]|nr:MAG: hypothetical protein M1821_003673 [Bathelium mastoideum]KAI9684961.1 MAG: hypothetical protein M1822_005610 [Bathelium mastoideum]
MGELFIDISKVHNLIPDFQLLRGRDNYTQWSRDIKVFAVTYGFWEVIGAQDAPTTKPQKPNFEDYFTVQPIQDASEAADAQTKINSFSANEIQIRKMKYDIDIKEYQEFTSHIDAARSILIRLVETPIRDLIIDLSTPRSMWSSLESMYKMDNFQARVMIYSQINKLNLSNCRDISDLCNKLNNYINLLQEIGGDYGNVQAYVKITESLPPEYKRFIDIADIISGTELRPWPNVEELKMKLLYYESNLRTFKVKAKNTH